MGLKPANSAVFLNIVEGKLVRRFKEPTKTSISRVTTEGNTVHEEHYRSIEGHVVGLEKQTHEKYGDRICVFISDDTLYCLQFGFDSSYGIAFLKTLPNVDLSLPVEFVPNQKVVNDKKKQTLFMKQNGTALKFAFNKENPGDLPEPVKYTRKGKEEWDFWPVTDWLEKNVFNQAKEFLKKGTHKIAPTITAEAVEQSDGSDEAKAKDDLPF